MGKPVAFVHMPRTGGTSYRVHLRGTRHQELDVGIEPIKGLPLYIGHFPVGYVGEANYFTIIREPYSRGISEYQYMPEGSDQLFTDPRFADFDNIQIRYLTGMAVGAGTPIDRRVTQDDFRKACSVVESISVGVFEDYSNAFNLFSRLCLENGLEIPAGPPILQNDSVVKSVPTDVLTAIYEFSKWDSLLYKEYNGKQQG